MSSLEDRRAAATPFIHGNAHQERAYFRRIINRSREITRTERDVLIVLINLWFYHHLKGEMHPGAEKIAVKARVSVRTVRTHLKTFREWGALIPLAYAKGGRRATRYRLNLDVLMDRFDPTDIVEAEGRLVEVCIRPAPNPKRKGPNVNPRRNPAKAAHGILTLRGDEFSPWYAKWRWRTKRPETAPPAPVWVCPSEIRTNPSPGYSFR